jgi:glucose-1-phosphate adenylyltransferase
VVVEKGAVIKDSVLMPNCVIRKGAVVSHAIVGWNAEVGENCIIGEEQKGPINGEWKIAVVGPNVSIKKGDKVAAGEMIGAEGGK